MKENILITGATGLLGRALVDLFLEKGFYVLAQYHSRQPEERKNCDWLRADFSTLEGINAFLDENRRRFKDCRYLVNNYGPITYKEISDLQVQDFIFDFHHNVITAFVISDFFIKNACLKSVVNLGFEFAGEIKPYRKILSYASAKNALLLITASLDQRYPNIRFHVVCPQTLQGAAVKLEMGKTVSPAQVARRVYENLLA